MLYDNTEPLLFLHIPKTGGTSIRDIVFSWFEGKKIYKCYKKEYICLQQYNAFREFYINKISDILLFGHFSNETRCIKEFKQIATIVRDPFKRVVSEYFHRKNKKSFKRPFKDITDYILNNSHSVLADRVPFKINKKNYKKVLDTKFLFTGVTDHLDESMIRLSKILNKNYTPGALPRLNVTSHIDEEIPYNIQEEFYEKFQLETNIYRYVLSQYI